MHDSHEIANKPAPRFPILHIRIMKSLLSALFCVLPFVASVSCREKGPAERAGESIDKAVDNVKDAVDPKGPVEKAGEKVDKALGK